MIDEKDRKTPDIARDVVIDLVIVTLEEASSVAQLSLRDADVQRIKDRVVARLGASPDFKTAPVPLDQVPMDVVLTALTVAGERAAKESRALGLKPAGH